MLYIISLMFLKVLKAMYAINDNLHSVFLKGLKATCVCYYSLFAVCTQRSEGNICML